MIQWPMPTDPPTTIGNVTRIHGGTLQIEKNGIKTFVTFKGRAKEQNAMLHIGDLIIAEYIPGTIPARGRNWQVLATKHKAGV